MTDGPRHLTAKQLAERLGVPVWSIRRLAREGALPSLRIGRRVRFRLADVYTAYIPDMDDGAADAWDTMLEQASAQAAG